MKKLLNDPRGYVDESLAGIRSPGAAGGRPDSHHHLLYTPLAGKRDGEFGILPVLYPQRAGIERIARAMRMAQNRTVEDTLAPYRLHG